jgi:hypothetical protein
MEASKRRRGREVGRYFCGEYTMGIQSEGQQGGEV